MMKEEEPIRIRFTQEVADFLKANGDLFDNHYRNFGTHLWYKDTDDPLVFEMLTYETLPRYIQSYVDNTTPKVVELRDNNSELVRHYETLLDDYCRVVYGEGLDGSNKHIRENRMSLIQHLIENKQF